MRTHALAPSVIVLAGTAGVALAPRDAAAEACDPVGHYQLGYSWHKGSCRALPGDALVELDVVRGPDGKYALGPQPEVVPLQLAVSPSGKGCKLIIEQQVNETAYGPPDPALWSMSLVVEGDVVKGTGTYKHVEGAQKQRQCQAAMSFTGVRSAAPPPKPVEAKAESRRSPEAIAKMLAQEIEPRREAMQACWQKAHPDGKGGKGWFRLHLAVRRDGTVRIADLIDDKLGEPAVAACVIEQAMRWTFSSPGADEVDWSVPVVFPMKLEKEAPAPNAVDGGAPPTPPPAK